MKIDAHHTVFVNHSKRQLRNGKGDLLLALETNDFMKFIHISVFNAHNPIDLPRVGHICEYQANEHI